MFFKDSQGSDFLHAPSQSNKTNIQLLLNLGHWILARFVRWGEGHERRISVSSVDHPAADELPAHLATKNHWVTAVDGPNGEHMPRWLAVTSKSPPHLQELTSTVPVFFFHRLAGSVWFVQVQEFERTNSFRRVELRLSFLIFQSLIVCELSCRSVRNCQRNVNFRQMRY